MSGSFVAALKAEIANLEAELYENKVYRRLGEARQLLALYDDEPAESGRSALRQMFIANAVKRDAARRSSPDRAKALDAARMFLTNRVGEPTPTGIIYDHIVSLGIEIGGNEPRNNLSAMLSNSPIFQSHGRAGWTLTDEANADGDAPSLEKPLFSGRELETRGYDAPPHPYVLPPKRALDDLK
jgi:hypothetical protein